MKVNLNIYVEGETKGHISKEKGKLFEQLMTDVLDQHGYRIDDIANVDYGVMEIDIVGESSITGDPIYVECKFHSKPISTNAIQVFHSKYMTRHSKQNSCNGLFIAIPNLNKNAKGYYKEHLSDHREFKINIWEQKEVIEQLMNMKDVSDLRSVIKQVNKKYKKIIKKELIFTQRGLYWILYFINSPNSEKSDVILLNSDGSLITDSDGLDFLIRQIPHIDEKGVLNENDQIQNIFVPGNYDPILQYNSKRILDQFFNKLKFDNKTQSTISNYAVKLNALISYFKLKNLGDINSGSFNFLTISSRHIIGFIDDQISNYGYGTSSVANSYFAVKSFIEFLLEEKIINNNPMYGINPPKRTKKDRNKIIDIHLFIEFLNAINKNIIVRTFLEVLFSSGAFQSELLSLKNLDIDFNKQIIKIHSNGKIRNAYLLNRTIEVMKLYQQWKINKFGIEVQKPTSLFFISSRGNDYDIRPVQKFISNYSKENQFDFYLRDVPKILSNYLYRQGVTIGNIDKLTSLTIAQIRKLIPKYDEKVESLKTLHTNMLNEFEIEFYLPRSNLIKFTEYRNETPEELTKIKNSIFQKNRPKTAQIINYPNIQYRPIENTLLLIYQDQVNSQEWKEIPSSTIRKSISSLKRLNFIGFKEFPFKILPLGILFIENLELRSKIFGQAALEYDSFKEFIKILNNAKSKLTLYELGSLLKEQLNTNWTNATSYLNVKIMLNWARNSNLLPSYFA